MSKGVEKALVAVKAALAALDEEIRRWREGCGVVSSLDELTAIRQHLVYMSDLLERNTLPGRSSRHLGLGRVIVDSWPHDSHLGHLIIAAEQAFKEA